MIFFEQTEVPEFPILEQAGVIFGCIAIEGGFSYMCG